ncbi:conserved hypothetical protein [Allorhizobium ampelinum S4]|uniref:DUF952 domain-containing protein n=2 Tax=Rhizobium/Agrobacterium group TaxID=227290 RepID=B9JR02_ALLAM|nr:conserved hypothetical protein [Allorhizobium ampelinum S4]
MLSGVDKSLLLGQTGATLVSQDRDKDDIMANALYKIVPDALWQKARADGVFAGAPIDLQDGFIHFSTAIQAKETARLHFAGQQDLLLVAVDGEALGAALIFEPSRGGALFPHLYAPLPLSAVLWEKPLPLGKDGLHQFPEEMA